MDSEKSRILRHYYNSAARDYASSIEPAFSPLARELVSAVKISADMRVLDLGCGTGIVSRSVGDLAGSVIALDSSLEMLKMVSNAQLHQVLLGDLHDLPMVDNCCDLALANFAFNSTDPVRAFGEALRVLKSAAWLYLQEWGEADPLSESVSEIFVDYMTDQPPPYLEHLRDQMAMELPWDELETVEEVKALLTVIGFINVDSAESVVNVGFETVDAFLRYKLAWPARKSEVAAMSADVRKLCLSDLHENLSAYSQADGSLIWQPHVYRIRAQKS